MNQMNLLVEVKAFVYQWIFFSLCVVFKLVYLKLYVKKNAPLPIYNSEPKLLDYFCGLIKTCTQLRVYIDMLQDKFIPYMFSSDSCFRGSHLLLLCRR